MNTVDISSLLIVTSPDVGSTSTCNLSVTGNLPTERTSTGTPIPSASATSAGVIGQSEKIATRPSPNSISTNQTVPMEVGDALPSATLNPGEPVTGTGNRPCLADILKGHEELKR